MPATTISIYKNMRVKFRDYFGVVTLDEKIVCPIKDYVAHLIGPLVVASGSPFDRIVVVKWWPKTKGQAPEREFFPDAVDHLFA